jgi:hypothetical protein
MNINQVGLASSDRPIRNDIVICIVNRIARGSKEERDRIKNRKS